MYRFFVEKKIDDKTFELSKDVINHLQIIRLKKDEKFYCIYNKKYYLCFLENKKAIIENEVSINNEWAFPVTLYASIINIKRFEWLVQKAAELGVVNFYPMITKNTNSKYVEIIKNKINRLNEISKNACEQSFRNIIMKIHEPIYFEEAIAIPHDQKIIAHEQSKDDLIPPTNFINNLDQAFYIGPEGGFTNEEIKNAYDKNIMIVSLGKRILRSETASIFLLSRIIEKI